MFKKALLTAVAVLSFASASHASTLDLLLNSTPGSVSYSVTNNGFTPNTALLSANMNLVTKSGVLNFDVAGIATAPSGSLYAGDYLFVKGGGKAIYTFAANTESFAFTWGSIEAFNTLTLNTTNGLYTITGLNVINYLASNSLGTSQTDLIINDPFGKILSAQFTSSANSFEAANFAQATKFQGVPLPASSVLFGFALAGLAMFGARRSVV